MQTFLPYDNFASSAHVLDNKRLGKQRVETLQILNALRVPNYGWKNHPAVRMWIGHEYLLCVYGKVMCNEWVRRGFADTCWLKINAIQKEIMRDNPTSNLMGANPWWLTDLRLTRSHQSNLIRKDPEHYRPLFPDVPPDLPYFWPNKEKPRAGVMNEAA